MPLLSDVLRQLPIRDVFSNDVIRDSRRANRIYFPENVESTAPALQYQFFANFEFNTDQDLNYTDFGFRVKRFDRPSVNFDTHVLNSYNKVRLAQTKVQYQPIQVSFYDTNDMLLQWLFWRYCAHYYGDFRNKDFSTMTPDMTSSEFIIDDEGWGFSPNPVFNPSESPFFSYIDLYEVSPTGRYQRYRLIRPLVDSWSLGTSDYEGTAISKEIVMTFRYEVIDLEVASIQEGKHQLDANFRIRELSDYAELPGPGRSLIETGVNVARDIRSGNFANIPTRLGLPGAAVISAVQRGRGVGTAIGAEAIGVVGGSSALSSFGNFNFGDAISASSVVGAVSSGASALGGAVSSLFTESSTGSQSISDNISANMSAAATNGQTQNFVSNALNAGPERNISGVDTNAFQVAQGAVTANSRMPNNFRDTIAAGVANSSKQSGLSVNEVVKSASQSDSSRNVMLTTPALREINKIKPSSSQYGNKQANVTNWVDPDLRRIQASKK